MSGRSQENLLQDVQRAFLKLFFNHPHPPALPPGLGQSRQTLPERGGTRRREGFVWEQGEETCKSSGEKFGFLYGTLHIFNSRLFTIYGALEMIKKKNSIVFYVCQ